MRSLKIQVFGGRGSRSGLGVGGPGIGFVDFINAIAGGNDSPIPEYDEYPDFPDPDYTNYKIKTSDSFINRTYNLMNYKRAEHEETGRKYLQSLRINPNVEYSTENDGSYVGYVQSYVNPTNGMVQVLKYNLNKADTRRMEYKVKTMFHEGYHASLDGLRDPGKKIPNAEARFHEETRTEMSAMFMANKVNGYSYVPSYTLEVISAAAKYKRLDEYKHCKTLYDLGEVFYNERMKNKSSKSFDEINKKMKTIKIDDNYYKKYYNRIINNSEKYYEISINSTFNFEYYNEKYNVEYKRTFDSMVAKIKTGEKLNSKEKNHFIRCVAIAMNDGGIL